MVESSEIIEYFKNLQNEICIGLEELDGAGKFQEDLWERKEGGGGRTRIINGRNIEKGGVNFSYVHGVVTTLMKESMKMDGEQWLASGVSIVLHPSSPMIPIIHMNVRYFELDGGEDWWFGGGIDLTPHYIDRNLARKFHLRMKSVCDKFGQNAYDKYKTWADDYFYLPHRKETRGVGGIFFDHLNERTGNSKEAIFGFIQGVGEAFLPAYREQFLNTLDRSYGEQEKNWQMIRRGRYTEFNLVWDRGTKFGLMSDGRTESILMSLPPDASWTYQFDMSDDENALYTVKWLRKGVEWISEESP